MGALSPSGRPTSRREPIALAVAAALLLGVLGLPGPQTASAAAQDITEEVSKAPCPGNDWIDVPGNEDVDDPNAVTVPYDPGVEGEVEPVGGPAECEQAPDQGVQAAGSPTP